METIQNKKALFNYSITDTIECGICLLGCEIKSIRAGNCNLKDSYALIKKNEIFLYNFHISPYENGSFSNSDPLRPKKLLLHKSEILKLIFLKKTQNISLVPLKAYFKGSNLKIELGIAKPKKLYDKRQDIAKKDAQRNIEKNIKYVNR